MNSQLQVDLAALAANYRFYAQRCVGAATMGGVVKADGYGLGAAAVSRALWDAGCREFFVATSDEGCLLRGVLGDADIYVFEGVTEDSAAALVAERLIPVINHRGQLDAWRQHSRMPIAVHVDTGMARLGFPDTLQPSDFEGFRVALLITHLACADTPSHPLNENQLDRFLAVVERFPTVRTSIGNSAGLLLGPRYAGDVGRPGIGLYGGSPVAGGANPVRTVAMLSASVLQVRHVSAGESVGYGATYVASADVQVATLGIGYADGVPRMLSNRGEVWIAGQRCPIIGRVSMDLTLVDVSGLGVQPGDRAELFGERISVDEVASWADTIAYEIFTGIGSRVERVYLRG